MLGKSVNLTLSGTTASGISAFRFVNIARTGYPAANAKAIGVTAYAAAAGEQFAIDAAGITRIELAATLSAGAAVTTDADGKAVAAAAVAAALTVEASAAVTGAIPAGETPVTSTSAQPGLGLSGTVTVDTATAAISGGVLPVAVNGCLLEGGSAGDIVAMLIA